MSRPQAVVFDVGTILVALDFPKLLEPLNFSHQEFQEWTVYDRFERGQITEEEFAQEAAHRRQCAHDMSEFETWWNTILLGPVPGIPELLQDLSTRVPLYGLTNTSPTHYRYLRQRYEWLSPLKEIYASFHFACRKPEPEIYHRTAAAVGLTPEQILFIDDNRANVEAAQQLGWLAEHSSGASAETRAILQNYQLIG